MGENEQGGMLRTVVVLGLISMIAAIVMGATITLEGKMSEARHQTTDKVEKAVSDGTNNTGQDTSKKDETVVNAEFDGYGDPNNNDKGPTGKPLFESVRPGGMTYLDADYSGVPKTKTHYKVSVYVKLDSDSSVKIGTKLPSLPGGYAEETKTLKAGTWTKVESEGTLSNGADDMCFIVTPSEDTAWHMSDPTVTFW